MNTQQSSTDALAKSSKGRRIGFRIAVTIVALWFLALHVFGLMEVVLMWLPVETLGEILGDGGADMTFEEIEAHRSHFMIIGLLSWGLILSVFAQWRRPERRVGSMQLVIVFALGGALVYALSGTLQDWLIEELAMVLIPTAILIPFHPRRRDLFKGASYDMRMLKVAVVGALPWLIYAFINGRDQLVNANDMHGAVEHWATAALYGIVLAAASFIGASHRDGWKLPAWFAALSPIVLGVHSMAFPGEASGLNTVWAVAAIGWGLAFAVTIVQRSKASAPQRTAAASTV